VPSGKTSYCGHASTPSRRATLKSGWGGWAEKVPSAPIESADRLCVAPSPAWPRASAAALISFD